jgi:hypothetical protein
VSSSSSEDGETEINSNSLWQFDQDTNTIISGPIKSGKSWLILHILKNGIFAGEKPEAVYILAPHEVIDSYSRDPVIRQIPYPVNFVKGSEDAFKFIDQIGKNQVRNSILVLDDLDVFAQNAKYARIFENLFHMKTHHTGLWTFVITHRLFAKGFVDLRQNTQTFIFFNLLQDRDAARQYIKKIVGPALEIFMSCWRNALNTHPLSKGFIRLTQRGRTHILTGNGITPSDPIARLYHENKSSIPYISPVADVDDGSGNVISGGVSD